MAISSTFETGVNGNTIATGDAGSPTAWNVVNVGTGTGAYIRYDNAQKYETLAAKIYAGSPSGGNNYVGWTTAFGTQTDHYGRMYLYNTGGWQSDGLMYAMLTGGISTALIVRASGMIEIRDSPNAQVGITTVALATNAWNRLEWHIVCSATVGSFQLKTFIGANADGTTPDETITATNLNIQASHDEIRFGILSSDIITLVLDNIVAAATSYPGPYVAAAGGKTGFGVIGRV